mmetsp:Transcript_31456/g.57096  ORF Transcript_31456/g.57096 Transcript_31456/m.57096 type:complete len:220 (-) Transcript_31456:636-1295(-)
MELVVFGEQQICSASGSRTTSAPDAMNIIDWTGEIIIDHPSDTSNVQSSSTYVRGNHHGQGAFAKACDHRFPLTLRTVPAEHFHAEAVILAMLANPLHGCLGCGKHKDSFARVSATWPKCGKQLQQGRDFVFPLHHVDMLRDAFVCHELFGMTDCDLGDWPCEQISCDGINFREPRGRVQQCLMCCHFRYDTADLLLKTHVKHAVCLIKNKHAALFEVC